MQVTYRIRLPKSKADILGSKGGAYMRIYTYLHNRYLCPVFSLSLWLLLVKPFLLKAIDDRYAVLVGWETGLRSPIPVYVFPRLQRESSAADVSDADVMKATLRSVYLFPKITKKGEPSFLAPLQSAAFSNRLAVVKGSAGYSDRPFTPHGLVRSMVVYSTFGEYQFIALFLLCRVAMLSFSMLQQLGFQHSRSISTVVGLHCRTSLATWLMTKRSLQILGRASRNCLSHLGSQRSNGFLISRLRMSACTLPALTSSSSVFSNLLHTLCMPQLENASLQLLIKMPSISLQNTFHL
jgi:hypothetical protein